MPFFIGVGDLGKNVSRAKSLAQINAACSNTESSSGLVSKSDSVFKQLVYYCWKNPSNIQAFKHGSPPPLKQHSSMLTFLHSKLSCVGPYHPK